jgi:DNA mismatch repair protein MutL
MINILPENISNKIAAGEVVQRPASVLKELLENSFDAGAKNIEVLVKGAGKEMIQVVDDGEGMDEKDAEKCIQRHATSKILDVEDLDAIKTYGFRGEALSSIAAVSRLELKTERHEEELGTYLKYDDDNKLQMDKGAYSKGTTVTVKNLFYNTPARRNFLKSHSTELKHLIDVFKKGAMSHPDISFKFYNHEDLVFDYSKGTIGDRLKAVINENIMDSVVEIFEETEFINISGYIAKPVYLRKSKGEQFVYVNKRYVTNKVINHAVFSAYENILEKGDYPFFILFLQVDPAKVDINVHPSKMEIKFEDERNIYRFVNAVTKKGLGKYDLVPNISLGTGDGETEKLNYHGHKFVEQNDFSDRPKVKIHNINQSEVKSSIFSDEEIDLLFSNINKDIRQSAPSSEVDHPFQDDGGKEIYHESGGSGDDDGAASGPAFFMSIHNKYILAQIKSGLMIIDQHVAHERILYEKALNSFEANMPFAQQLLFAQTVQVDPADYELLKELEEYLVKLGFEIKFFSKRTIVINGVPSDIKVGSEVDTLLDIINEYRKNQVEKQLEARDNLAKSFSCTAAIKAGDKLNEHEMRLLVDQLFATSMPYVCPHGRPVIIKIPLTEFDKRFGRT